MCEKTDRLHIILVAKEQVLFAELAKMFAKEQRLNVTFIGSNREAMEVVTHNKVDVAIIADELPDSTGLQLVKDLVLENPFINCALVSALYPDEFHEATEGYGVFLQLPPLPGPDTAKKILTHLDKIYQLSL